MLQLIKRSDLLNGNDCIIFDFIVLGFLVNALLYVLNWLDLNTLFDMVNAYFWEYASAKAIGGLTFVVLFIIAASILFRRLEPVAVRFDKRLGAILCPLMYLFLGASLCHFLLSKPFGLLKSGIELGLGFILLVGMCTFLRLTSSWAVQFAGRKRYLNVADSIHIGVISAASFVLIIFIYPH